MRDDAAGLSFLGSMYAIGAVLIGVILIADNLILLVRNGNLESEPDGKAVGLTAVFMGMVVAYALSNLRSRDIDFWRHQEPGERSRSITTYLAY